MLEAVVLGVAGVLVPRQRFWEAGIEAAARCLEASEIRRATFRPAALRRLRRCGPRSLISRSLRDLNLEIPAARVREAILAARAARPRVSPDAHQRSALRHLASGFRLACLDAGEPSSLDETLRALGLDDLPEYCLWVARLGGQAQAPSRLGFRWLEERLELRPAACLYVTGSADLTRGAARAGWRVWPETCSGANEDVIDVDALVERVNAAV
ncbi:MAG: hypothetical protein ACE5G2_10495 [Candidatus Krumholzibacteriia bacterium]